MVKFRWVPNSPENEAKFLEEMKKEYPITSETVKQIQKDLVAKGNGIGNKLVPMLASMSIKISFGKPSKIKGCDNKVICYICELFVTPPYLEAGVKETAIRLGAGKFFTLIGFNYGKVEFFR